MIEIRYMNFRKLRSTNFIDMHDLLFTIVARAYSYIIITM
jgi:hypothetical protein